MKTHIDDRGFSLIETLVSLLILAFVSISVLAMFAQGAELNATGRDHQTLNNMARDQLEELMSLPFAHADLVANQTHVESPAVRQGIVRSWRVEEYSLNETNFTPQLAFANPVTAGSGNIKIITVTVEATGAFGFGDRSITVQAVKKL